MKFKLCLLLLVITQLVGCEVQDDNLIDEPNLDIVNRITELTKSIKGSEEYIESYVLSKDEIGGEYYSFWIDIIDGYISECKELGGTCSSKFEDSEYVPTYVEPTVTVTSSTSQSSSNSKLFSNDKCKEIKGDYTDKGLRVIGCSYSAGEIVVTIQNNSSADLSYLRIEIYGIDNKGKTISSYYTNHASIIRSGAIQKLDTHVDNATIFEIEISDITIDKIIK